MRRLKDLLVALLCLGSAVCGAGEFVALDRAAAGNVVNPASYAGPAIVALWSSECIHCKKNLKLFAEMAKANPQLKLVTIAVEPAMDGLAEPLDRLAVPGARFAYGSESSEALGYALDPKWRGELPRTILFDGRGGKVALSGVISEATARTSLGIN